MSHSSEIVLFVLPSMEWGGMQRTILNIVNYIDRERYRPVVALYRKEGSYLNLLVEDVTVEEVKSSRARFSVLRLAEFIRDLRPDVILSTLRYINVGTLLSATLARTGAAVVLRETNHQTAAGVGTGSWREKLVGWSYRRAHRVIALSCGVREDVIERYRIPPEQVVTIYNPIDLQRISELAEKPVNDAILADELHRGAYFQIIAAGALHRQKGYDLLIKAVAQLRHIPFRLRILGEGSEKSNLARLVNELGVRDRVFFMGFRENPYAFMVKADLFVLSSRWEGFGHVIAEAMVCGVPVLAARCRSGPDEIITDEVDGRLCEHNSVSALASHIEELWKDPGKRKRYAATARESVRRFDARIIVKEYERLFSEAVSK